MFRAPRRHRLSMLWIVFSLTALLGCKRASGLLPKVDELTGPLSAPSPTVVEETIGAGDRTLRLGPTVDLGRAVIPVGGGTASIDAPDDSMYGLALEIPPDAYAGEVEVGISYRNIEEHSLGERFVPRSPLIEVEMGGGYAARTVQLTIPTAIPEGEVPVALTFVPGSERMEAMRVLAKSASSVTVGGRRIGNVVLTSVDEWFLFEHDFETGFKHGVDSWQFTNWGAYPTPAGNCTGMTMSAMAYYMERRSAEGKPPLYGLYDNHDNPFYATSKLEADDRLAIRLVSMVQAEAVMFQDRDWNKDMTQEELLAYVLSDEVEVPPTPVEVYDAIVSAMFFTGEPQLVAVRTEKSGHALIAYKKVGNSIYLSDPNHPNAAEGADKIVFDPETGKFEPYMIGGTPYPTVAHLGATSDWDMVALNGLWRELDDGTVGEDAFPAYTIHYAPPDGFWFPLENNMEFYDDELWFHVQASAFVPRVTLYVESAGVPRQVDQAEGDEEVHVQVQPGVTALGFLIEAKSPEGYSYAEGPGTRSHTWVDYRWFNVLLQEEEEEVATPIVEPTATQPAAQCNALDEVVVLVRPTSVDPDGEPSWVTGRNCKASVAFVNRNPEVQVRVLVRKVDDEDPDAGQWLNYPTQQVAPEDASYPHLLNKHWDQDGVVDNWSDFLEFKAFYTGAGYYHCNALADDPAAADLPTAMVEHPCRAFDPNALPAFSGADCACAGLAAPTVKADGQGSGYSCTYDWGYDAGLNNIKLSVRRHDSPEAAAEAYAYNHDRIASAGAEAGVVTQALEESANSLTRVEQQTNKNHVFYGAWWGHRVVRYRQAVITLYLAAKELGGAGEVMAALDAAQSCAEAAIDRYESDCEAQPIGCSP